MACSKSLVLASIFFVDPPARFPEPLTIVGGSQRVSVATTRWGQLRVEAIEEWQVGRLWEEGWRRPGSADQAAASTIDGSRFRRLAQGMAPQLSPSRQCG